MERSCAGPIYFRDMGMTSSTKPRFRADVVGSFLRPDGLKQAREQAGLELTSTADKPSDGAITAEQLKQTENDCIRDLVSFEEAVGLKAVTDGEFRRGSWAYDFIGQVEGIELRRQDGSYDASFSNTGFRPPIAHAISKVGRRPGGMIAGRIQIYQQSDRSAGQDHHALANAHVCAGWSRGRG